MATKKDKPTSGQSGPPLTVAWDELHPDAQKLYNACTDNSSIDDLARAAYNNKPNAAKANLKVRNWLRVLTRASYLEKIDRGRYKKLSKPSVRNTPAAKEKAPPATPKAAKPGKPTKDKKAAKAKGGKKEAKGDGAAAPTSAPTTNGEVSLEQLKEELQEIAKGQETDVGKDDDTYRTALIVLAGAHVGYSDSKIHHVTHFSRGFIIPRLKRVKKALDPIPLAQPPDGPAYFKENAKQFWEIVKFGK